jgi:hypothetical protein
MNNSDRKFRNIKYYCKKYGISVKKGDKFLPVGVLSKKIYDYEVSRGIKNGYYPFF